MSEQIIITLPMGLSSMLSNLPPEFTTNFNQLFSTLPDELSGLFFAYFSLILNYLPTTLPSTLTTPPSEVPPESLNEFTELLTIMVTTLFTIVTLTVPSYHLLDVCFSHLTAMHNTLYTNPYPHLPGLLDCLQTVLHATPTAQPHSELTNFPHAITVLFNSPPSSLIPLSSALDLLLTGLVSSMLSKLSVMLQHMLVGLRNNLHTIQYDLDQIAKQFKYHAGDGDEDGPDSCRICLDDFKEGDNVRSLCCWHIFHVDCIDLWLQMKDNCPVCRTHINSTGRSNFNGC